MLCNLNHLTCNSWYHCTKTKSINLLSLRTQYIDNPFAIAVYKMATTILRFKVIYQVAAIVDGNITLLEGPLGLRNDALTQSFLNPKQI